MIAWHQDFYKQYAKNTIYRQYNWWVPVLSFLVDEDFWDHYVLSISVAWLDASSEIHWFQTSNWSVCWSFQETETPWQGPKAVNGIMRQMCRQIHGTANDVDTNVAPEVFTPEKWRKGPTEKGPFQKG